MKKILSLVGICTAIGAGWFSWSIKSNDFMIASLGDSTTTAFNSEQKWNNMQNSWATGESIDSHVVKLRQKFPDKKIRFINLAIPGVDSRDIERQAEIAARVPLNYVSILIGSNDLCRGKVDINDYRRRLYSAVDILIKSSPDIKILISSIPNIAMAREVAKDLVCDKIWTKLMQRCDVSDEDRFYDDWWKINAALELLAQSNKQVKFSDAVMNQKIEPDSLSHLDCFHPSRKAQEDISEITWNQGWYK